MIPNVDDFIIIYFKIGLQISGKVINWSDTKAVIINDNNAKIVINNTSQDILFYKILEAKKEIELIKEKPIKSDEDIRKVADLKIELNKLEKEELKEKLLEHTSTGMREVQYGLPSSFKIPSVKKHTEEKVTRTDNKFDSELQNLFSKKNKL